MSNIINLLNELNAKHKKNSKLSAADTETMVAGIAELLSNSEEWNTGFDFIMNCPAEIGIQAYVNYYNSLDRDNRIKLNNKFVKSDQFKKNAQNKSVYRASVLLGKFIENKGTQGEIVFILRHLCNLVYPSDKKEASNQNLKYIQEEVISKCGEWFHSLDLSGYNISDREMYFIQRMFINASLLKLGKVTVSPVNQYSVLKWLIQMGRKLIIEKNEENLIADTFITWPDGLKDAFTQDPDMVDTYGKYIKKKIEANTGDEVIKKDGKSDNREPCIEDRPVPQYEKTQLEKPVSKEISADGLKPGPKELISILDKYIDEYEKRALESEKVLKEVNLELTVTKAKLDDSDKNVQRLKYQLESNESKIKLLSDEIINLKSALLRKDDEIDKLRKSEEEYKTNMQILYGVGTREDSSQLTEFRNKLAAKLRYDYMNFKDIETSEMTADIGENIRIQLMNIFNELKRQGVRLE